MSVVLVIFLLFLQLRISFQFYKKNKRLMAKKKLDKEAESTPSSPSKIVAVCKNETVHFVIGLMLVIFSVYLLLAFSSFFFTGAAMICFLI